MSKSNFTYSVNQDTYNNLQKLMWEMHGIIAGSVINSVNTSTLKYSQERLKRLEDELTTYFDNFKLENKHS